MKRSIALLLVFIIAAASYGTWHVNAQQTASTPETAPNAGTTILLMGVDQAEDGAEIDVGVRPDSLLVLHLNSVSGSCRLLSIPRDSRVEVPGVGLTKVNHALSIGGVPMQRAVVETFLNIEIDHFGLVDFQGLSGVVDAVGGITVQNQYAFTLGDDHFAEGEITLDGRQALRFSRYRGGPDGDFGRMERQQLVLRGILGELTTLSPIQTVPRLLTAIEGHFRTDLTLPEMINLATQYQTTCTTETLETRTLIGANAMFTDPLLQADLWFVVIEPEDVEAGVRWLQTGEED